MIPCDGGRRNAPPLTPPSKGGERERWFDRITGVCRRSPPLTPPSQGGETSRRIRGGVLPLHSARFQQPKTEAPPTGRNATCPCLMPAPVFWTIAICFAFLGAPAASAQVTNAKKPVDPLASEPEIVTRTAVCRWAAEPPVLDGKLDDPCWQRAAVIDRFASFWMDPPRSRPGTNAYLSLG